MARPQVYITRKIPREAVDIIAAACDYRMWEKEDEAVPAEVLDAEIAGVDGVLTLLTEKWDAARLARAPRLRVLANMAVGYDNIRIPDCTARGVLVTNTPGVLTETTADLTWALLMATARRIPEAERVLRAGQWKTWSPMMLTGQDVFGRTLGIVGLGRIGQAVARRARGFAMRILYHNRRRDPAAEAELGAEYRPLPDLLREADFVVVLVPLSPETRGLIGARELALMKPTAVLVNAARGGIVDEAALYDALKHRRIWAAGLDVWEQEPVPLDHPLLTLDNVVALPHIGSASIATRTRMATLAAENLVAALTGRRPPTPVNPEAWGLDRPEHPAGK
ncbi:2-hydroxyacid dehydrogenase [Caldinitratiruptor microaerophilus]|uniref:D-glycerate dehydrogenase n=1 Tax=Caldinitratiruptor microaerophilus TaxID=671077 RepID=A0AA35CP61_9FIRM|nr:D-glycerate dehydrogenase [Caldinitratiruptor microaerophilus]BDG62188.1 D-glycerate dehydrogenase [Caldinitratiruptor microaerophilus]